MIILSACSNLQMSLDQDNEASSVRVISVQWCLISASYFKTMRSRQCLLLKDSEASSVPVIYCVVSHLNLINCSESFRFDHGHKVLFDRSINYDYDLTSISIVCYVLRFTVSLISIFKSCWKVFLGAATFRTHCFICCLIWRGQCFLIFYVCNDINQVTCDFSSVNQSKVYKLTLANAIVGYFDIKTYCWFT